MDVIEALEAESGLVCVVGAGGKKTTLYALSARAVGRGTERVVVTATVRIPIFDPQVDRVVVTESPVRAIREADDWPLGVVPARERDDRYEGYETNVVDDLARAGAADLVLVKADGARTREFKAPADREPQLPRRADTVIPVASVQAVGKPLSSEYVHRPERVAAITGLELGEEIRPTDVARVLASDRGGAKSVPPGASIVPLINKVDDENLRAVGETIATEVLDRSAAIDRVVLARMIDEDPLVAVVE